MRGVLFTMELLKNSLCWSYGRQASGVPGALSRFALTDLALFARFALTYSMYPAGAKTPAAYPSASSGRNWTAFFNSSIIALFFVLAGCALGPVVDA